MIARADDAKPITFDDHIAAILKKHCVQCHGESKQQSGLNFASYATLMKGGSGGEVVQAGRSGASRLVEVISAADPAERMPPKSDPVPAEQIALIKTWIDTGLRENAGSSVAAMRTLGFKPTAASQADSGPPPLPVNLPTVEKRPTHRPFPVLALAASPRAPVVAVASYEAIDLLDPATGNPLGTIAFPEGEPLVLKFSPSGRVLLAAGGNPVQNGAAVLFDVTTGKRLASVGDEPDAVIAADISPDERQVAIGGSGKVVKIFSTEDGSVLHTLVKHTDWITALAFSPDGKLLATGDRIGNIHLWDANGGGIVLPLSEHKGAIRALAWRSDSGVVASCGEDGAIVWWDVKDGWPTINKSNAHPPVRPDGFYGKIASGVLDATFGPHGELATCGRDGIVRRWAADGKELQSFSIASGPPADGTKPAAVAPKGVKLLPTRVAISADGSFVLAGDSAGQLHVWPTDSNAEAAK
ncbi:MAG: c-type cytochrome domain-containing protein [Planctomycetota bacterium]